MKHNEETRKINSHWVNVQTNTAHFCQEMRFIYDYLKFGQILVRRLSLRYIVYKMRILLKRRGKG